MTVPGVHPWDRMVVLCAANNYDGIKLADQHMAECLSQLVPVLYVDPPLSWLTPVKNPAIASSLQGPRLRFLQPRLARLTPVVQPGPSRPGMPPITSALARRYIRRAVSRLGGQVLAVVSAWPQYRVFGSSGEHAYVYWAQDDFVGGAALLGFNAGQLDKAERKVAAAADIVVAASPVVAETWRDRGLDTVMIPYGANVDSFAAVDDAPLPSDVRLDAPIAGVVGQFNERTDIQLLEAVADRGHSLLLVGPVDPAFRAQGFDALLARPNVCWVGPKPFDALPGYLRLIDVGLVPYRDSPFNRSSFPLKTLEYLAAGRAVVATDLPATRWLATDLVAIPPEPGRFGDYVGRMLNEAKSPALISRRQEFAALHSWKRRAEDIYEIILKVVGK